MSSDGDNKNKTDFFFRIGWAAGAACAPPETVQNASPGVVCLTVTAQHAPQLAEALSSSALGRHSVLTLINPLPPRLKLTAVPPAWSPPQRGAEPGAKQGPMGSAATESQTGRGWQGPLGVTQTNPLPKQGHPEQAAQHRVQAGLEYLQRRRLHSLPGQPGPGLRHPQGEEVLPRVQLELPLLQFVPIAPCPVAGHHWKESGPVLLTPTLQIFISIYVYGSQVARANELLFQVRRPLGSNSARVQSSCLQGELISLQLGCACLLAVGELLVLYRCD